MGAGRRARTAADCLVPRRPVALGDRVGDVLEGGAHQVERLVAEGRHVVRRHALRLNLGQDLQPDGSCREEADGGESKGVTMFSVPPSAPLQFGELVLVAPGSSLQQLQDLPRTLFPLRCWKRTTRLTCETFTVSQQHPHHQSTHLI